MAVLLTRPEAQNHEIIPEIKAMGYQVVAEPMLEIKKLAQEPLKHRQGYGYIFSSVRAVENLDEIDSGILAAPVLVVGEKTANALKKRGFQNILHVAPSAKQLQIHIDQTIQQLGHDWVYVSGRDISHNFTIGENEISRYLVYSAEFTQNFTENLLSSLHNGTIDIALFYSVRTAENFINLIKQYAMQEKCASIHVICISTRTAEVLKDVQWKKLDIAQEKDHQHMMMLLEPKRAPS